MWLCAFVFSTHLFSPHLPQLALPHPCCLLSPEACAFNVTCNDSLACPLSLVLAAVIALSGTGIAGGSVAPWRELCSFWPTKLNFPGPGHTALPATITPRPPSILAWRLRL